MALLNLEDHTGTIIVQFVCGFSIVMIFLIILLAFVTILALH